MLSAVCEFNLYSVDWPSVSPNRHWNCSHQGSRYQIDEFCDPMGFFPAEANWIQAWGCHCQKAGDREWRFCIWWQADWEVVWDSRKRLRQGHPFDRLIRQRGCINWWTQIPQGNSSILSSHTFSSHIGIYNSNITIRDITWKCVRICYHALAHSAIAGQYAIYKQTQHCRCITRCITRRTSKCMLYSWSNSDQLWCL